MGPALLKNIIKEINGRITGGLVSKVHQMDDKNLLIKVFAAGRDERLLISAHPRFSRIYLTKETFTNPPSPLRFCAYLRSRITNARIDGLVQIDEEKIVHIDLKKKTDDTVETLTLVCELTGKSSNIILIDEKGVILDSLKYFEPESSPRAVVPGLPLIPLPARPKAEGEEAMPKDEGESWNEAADRYYSSLLSGEEFTLEKSRLRRVINEADKKARRKLTNLNGDKTRAEAEKGYGKLGELIVYNLKNIKRGAPEAEAVDYTAVPPETVKVRLDPKLSPKENADKYFKRAKKAKVAIDLLKDRIPQVEGELEYISSLLYELEASNTKDDLTLLKDELIEGGYIKEMTVVKEEKEERVEPVRRMTSSEGFEILCGKSGPGNDLIVKKYASNEDIWFHVSKMPGSHVLIKVAGRLSELTKKTIEEAASLAAWHSKAQNAGKIEVIYTEAKHVKKPRGAKPGMVTVKEYKSIVVRPRELMEEKG